MKTGLILFVTMLGAGCHAQGDVRYIDPQKRFEVQLPARWQTKQLNADAVQFSVGSSYLTLLTLPGADAVAILNTFSSQSARQWRNFREEIRGGAELGGVPGSMAVYSGIAPNGNESILRLVAGRDGNRTFLLMASVPRADYNQIKTSLDGIQAGFRILNGKTATNEPVAREVAGGWRKHDDAAGFTVEVPASWSVRFDQGRVIAEGTDGSRAMIWPARLSSQRLNPALAQVLLQRVAEQMMPGAGWQNPRRYENTIVTMAQSSSVTAVAILRWSGSGERNTTIFYVGAAPTGRYGNTQPALARIFESFSPKVADGVRYKDFVQPEFVSWTDPAQGSFSVKAPKGWTVAGGTYVLAPTDVRTAVTMVSQNAPIQIQAGMLDFGSFIAMGPRPFMSTRPGDQYPLGDGSRLLIYPYMSGDQFARFYLAKKAAPCVNIRVTSNRARPDLAPLVRRVFENAGMPLSDAFSVGDVEFSCTRDGQQLKGAYTAATKFTPANGGTIWTPIYFSGYLTAPELAQDVEKLAETVNLSFRPNMQWVQRQAEIIQDALRRDSRRAQEFQQGVFNHIVQQQGQVTKMIDDAYAYRSRATSESSRKWENAILGKVDVYNPQTGDSFKLENTSNYYWMNASETKIGTVTDNAPGPEFTQLTKLP